MTLEKTWPLIEKFDNDVFKIIFPNSNFLPSYFAGTIGGKFSYENLFLDTEYEVKKTQELLHFTTLQSLTSILNNGYLRLSEFKHFEDKNELHYASKIFEKTEFSNRNRIEKKKNNFFALSTCSMKEETITNSFMWEKYGNKAKGVVIQFKLEFKKEYKFLFGKIQYGENGLKNILQLKNLQEKFKEENDGFEFDHFNERIIEFLAFHKEEKYKSEEEIRLFIKQEKREYSEHNHEAIYEDITYNNEVRYFFKPFLTERKEILEAEINDKKVSNEYFDFYPTIKIEKIILGNGLSLVQKVEIFRLLSNIKKKYNYDYSLSQLTNENKVQEAWGF
jgi:hypothetical protein